MTASAIFYALETISNFFSSQRPMSNSQKYMKDTTIFDSVSTQSIELLNKLINTPSFSRDEKYTADILENFLLKHDLHAQRTGNNVWVKSRNWDDRKPVLLLNSHHDTVKPVAGWTKDPFNAHWEDGKLYGLGSNDAGGALMALLATFLLLEKDQTLQCNLLLAMTAEEEISGSGGISSILHQLGRIDCGIVGEPTRMHAAIAERGLVVIDGEARGSAGHAAREEGINALYIAIDDIQRLRTYKFAKVSELLGPVKISVTQMQAGHQHNVVPDRCSFVVDVRVNEYYSLEEILGELQSLCHSQLKARSLRLNPSSIPADHPLVQAAKELAIPLFGSSTLSDQALLYCPTIKIGPGDSARSHTADEYITKQEILDGIGIYVDLIVTYAKLSC